METCFVVTAPGLEPLAAAELRRIGLRPAPHAGSAGVEEGGGVLFQGEWVDIYRANLHLRTASRIVVRLGEFHATQFGELRKKASALAWERFLKPGQAVSFHVTCHKSRLYHSDAVAERVAGAIGDHLGRAVLVKKEAAENNPSGGAAVPPDGARKPSAAGDTQLILVRFNRDVCTISIDSSGELLHRRGYRLETAKAPLRETLAAAMLLASGWDGAQPLLDPFCGSGTIVIEAALLAAARPPGAAREFAFMHWPGFERARWEALRAAASVTAATNAGAKNAGGRPILMGSDRDAGAIRIAQANAARAGVAEAIQFTCCAVSAIQPPPTPGWVITNPPYGLRVSANKDLRNLYAQFGHVLHAQCPGWRVVVLSSDRVLTGQMGLELDAGLATVNGGLPVRIVKGKV